jgi:hypothetical protein
MVVQVYIHIYIFCLFVFAVLGFELRAYTLSHSTSTFFWGGGELFCFFMKDFFKIVSQTICPGWL